MKNKVMQIVEQICNTKSTDCKSLNKAELARELMDLANIPHNASIEEIPLDWDNQVVILFVVPEDKENYYSLFSGIGNDGNFYFELSITGKNPFTDKFYFLDDEEILSIDYFVNKVEITEEIKQFIETTAKTAVSENRDMTIEQCITEYTSQILENDYYSVVNWANWKGIKIPEKLKSVIDPEF